MDEFFEYAAWFRDSSFPPDDQDFEWPAVFVVRAPNAALAQEWGDVLSSALTARRTEQRFLWSAVEATQNSEIVSLPIVNYGETVSDEFIGW